MKYLLLFFGYQNSTQTKKSIQMWSLFQFIQYGYNLNQLQHFSRTILNTTNNTLESFPTRGIVFYFIFFKKFYRLFLYLTLDRFGRRWITVFTFTTLGICCTTLAFIPKSETNIILGLYLLGKLAGAASFQVSK